MIDSRMIRARAKVNVKRYEIVVNINLLQCGRSRESLETVQAQKTAHTTVPGRRCITALG